MSSRGAKCCGNSFLVVIAREQSDRGNLPGGWRSTEYIFFTLDVGYFATAQYDVLFIPYRHFVPLPPKEEAKLHVILNEVKNPTEELTGIYFSLKSWDISLPLNMTCTI